jgi:hypothetical protein
MQPTYTVGVKRRFFFGFRKFKVIAHETEGSAGFGRLVLTLDDGGFLVIPRLDRLAIKIYPDYRTARTLADAQKARKSEAPPIEG